LQAVLLDDPFHAPDAGGEVGLAELLSDDSGGSVGVEESVADDLSDDLRGADVVRLGSAFLAEEGLGAVLLVTLEQLIIAWFADPVLCRGGHGAESFALSLEEHAEASGDLVVVGEDEFPRGTDDPLLGEFEAHDVSLQEWRPKGGRPCPGGYRLGSIESNKIWRLLREKLGDRAE
jgi:hypothetical protein